MNWSLRNSNLLFDLNVFSIYRQLAAVRAGADRCLVLEAGEQLEVKRTMDNLATIFDLRSSVISDFFYEPNICVFCNGSVRDKPDQRAYDEAVR